MRTKFICRSCAAVTAAPRKGTCTLLGSEQHDWIPFTESDDVQRKDYYDTGFNHKWAGILATIISIGVLIVMRGKHFDDIFVIILGLGGLGYFLGGFLKQIMQFILGCAVLIGVFWLLDYFKIVDFTPKPEQKPPKVIKVQK